MSRFKGHDEQTGQLLAKRQQELKSQGKLCRAIAAQLVEQWPLF